MSEFVFPSSPATGATTTNPNTGAVYLWDGNKWLAIPGGARVTFDATEPTEPRAGDFWYDLTDNELKVFDGVHWLTAVGGAAGGVTIDADEPLTPGAGNLWWDPVDAKLYLYNGEEWIIVVNTAGPPGPRGTTGGPGPEGPPGPPGPIPIAYSFPGQPPDGTKLMVSISIPLLLALGDSTAHCDTPAAASATFAINKISGGATTAVGTVVFGAGNSVGAYTGFGGALEAGDVLEVVAPATQDATLADVAITILAHRIETGGVGGDGLTVAQVQAVQAMINTAMAGVSFDPTTTGSGNTFVLQQGPTINQPRVMGITDGSNAATGEVEEYLRVDIPMEQISSGGGWTRMPNTLTLSPGDWEVEGLGYVSNLPITTASICQLLDTDNIAATYGPPAPGADSSGLAPGIDRQGVSLRTKRRWNVTTSTNIVLWHQIFYPGAAPRFEGNLIARRMR